MIEMVNYSFDSGWLMAENIKPVKVKSYEQLYIFYFLLRKS